MNTLRLLLVMTSLIVAPMAHAANTAQARLHCWSLRFGTANAYGAQGYYWEVDLTTLPFGLNGELGLDPSLSYTHYSYMEFYDDVYEVLLGGELGLDVPEGGDANNNGFPDFFEASQPVNNLVTSGSILFDGETFPDPVQATWNREAGSSFGYCTLTMPDPLYPFVNITITHFFTLLDYQGVLTYTPGATNVTGTLSVTNNYLFDVLGGTLEFVKSATNPANALTLVSAALTNLYGYPLGFFTETLLAREAAYPTNYFGLVEVLDGDPLGSPSDDDYYTWQLSIDDLNDADHDGIPDFSDSLNVAPPRPPELVLTRGTGALLLTIHGDVGVEHLIERSPAATGAAWTPATSVTLTNDPQTVPLSLPTNTTFWRARILVGP